MSCVNDIVGPYGVSRFGRAVQDELATGKTTIDLAWTDITWLLYVHHVSWAYYVEMTGSASTCRKSRKTACPGNWPIALPGASNIYNFHGPNFICDAACASAMAAMTAAVDELVQNDFDAVITGGIDRNMGIQTFVKFCKIGALSATGTRPYAEGADGFVMGEGSAIFVLSAWPMQSATATRFTQFFGVSAHRATAKEKESPPPIRSGQKVLSRASLAKCWPFASLRHLDGRPWYVHRVGDVVEAQSLSDLLSSHHLPTHSVALGSVKSNIGHLKGAAGAAGLLKTVLALRDKVLPPSVNCEHPSPDIDFAHSPLYVNTELRAPWTASAGSVPRRAGVSAFGFGGTNFHIVLEEHIPHRLTGNGKRSVSVSTLPQTAINEVVMNAKQSPTASASSSSPSAFKAPLRGALLIGATSEAALTERLRAVLKDAEAGLAPAQQRPPRPTCVLRSAWRLTTSMLPILRGRQRKHSKQFAANQALAWKALRAQGIFRGHGPAPKVAFLYTGQGSQYVNMLRPLYKAEPIVTETFAQADRVMTPLLGKPLTDFVFVDDDRPESCCQSR